MRAAIYGRKSDDSPEGVDRQITIAREFAASRGWTVAAEFKDNAESGGLFDRPGLNDLQAAIAERPVPFEALVIMDSSRLGRDMGQTLLLQQRITRAGVRIFHYQDGQELLLNTPTQKLVASVSNYAAEDYRFQVAAKTRSALRAKAAAGDVVTGAAYGYRIVDKRLVIDPEQAAVVVRIFTMAAEGLGARRIANTLRDERVTAPAAEWTASGVKKILARDTYRGVAVYGRTKCQLKDNAAGQPVKVKVAVPKSEWITTSCPELQIVSPQLWDAAYARLGQTRDAYLRANNGQLQSKPSSGLDSKYLLSGLLKCGVCGGNIIVIEAGRSYACSAAYRRGASACSATRRHGLKRLDSEILAVLDRVMTPELIAQLAQDTAARIAAEPTDLAQERAIVAAEISRLEGARQRLLDVLEDGTDPGGVKERLTERTRDLRAAQARAEHLEGQSLADRWGDPVYLARLQRGIAELKVYLSGSPDRSEPLPVSVQRQLLKKLLGVESITVTSGADGAAVDLVVNLAGGALEPLGSPDSLRTTGPAGERAG